VDVSAGDIMEVEIVSGGTNVSAVQSKDLFSVLARHLPVPPASTLENALELGGNQTVDFSTSVVPPSLYKEGFSVYWFSYHNGAEHRKGLALTLCRTSERDELLDTKPERFLSEASCSDSQ